MEEAKQIEECIAQLRLHKAEFERRKAICTELSKSFKAARLSEESPEKLKIINDILETIHTTIDSIGEIPPQIENEIKKLERVQAAFESPAEFDISSVFLEYIKEDMNQYKQNIIMAIYDYDNMIKIAQEIEQKCREE